MSVYEVVVLIDASISKTIDSDSPENAASEAEETTGFGSLCWQCSRELETADSYGANVYLDGKLVLDTTRAGQLEAENATLKARIAELEQELAGWMKSHDEVNARCIALSERYE